jgi:DNA repair exonuclease SbcCD ATPase subunit
MSDQLPSSASENVSENGSVVALRPDGAKTEPLVTDKSVAQACEAIRARGERVTSDRVRKQLSGGSPNDILPRVRDWKAANLQSAPKISSEMETPADTQQEARPDIAALADVPSVKTAFDALDAAVIAALKTMQEKERSRAVDQIQSIQDATTRQLKAERERAQSVIDQNAAIAEAQVQDAQVAESEMANSLSAALEDIKSLQAEKDRLQAEISELNGSLEAERLQVKSHKNTLDEITAERNRLTVERDTLTQHLEASNARVQELTDDRAEQSQRYKDLVKERDQARELATHTTDTLNAVRARIEDLHDQVTEAKSALARTEAQRDSALERLEEYKTERKAHHKADPQT